MDPYEKLRRLLVDGAYSGCDIEADQELHRTANNAIEVVRHLIDTGRELEAMVEAASCAEDVEAIVAKLVNVAAEQQAMGEKLLR